MKKKLEKAETKTNILGTYPDKGRKSSGKKD